MDPSHIAFAGPHRQREMLRSGDVKVRELVELYLARIQRLDGRVNSYRVVLSDSALAAADTAQAAVDSGDDRPLLGIPFAVKDSMDVAGELSCAGTDAMTTVAETDSEIVSRLRAAGAIPLGKTHTPELCLWHFTETKTYGATRNPWDPDRIPGGSSGGTAAAVASGLASFGTGSDGGGSIRLPAACCGLFGLKPQRGRVPGADGWNGLSVNGVLTRRVQDTAIVLDVIADRDDDPDSFSDAAERTPDQLRIGVAANSPMPWVDTGQSVLEGLEETADRLSSLGHEVDAIEIDYGRFRTVLPYWLRYLDGVHGDVAALDDASRLAQSTRLIAHAGALVPSVAVDWAARAGDAIARDAERVFADVDVVLTPATPKLPPPIAHADKNLIELTRDASNFATFTPFWNLTGQPAAAVPAGFASNGVPRAVQVVATRNGERTLLSLAAQLEAVDDWATHRPHFD